MTSETLDTLPEHVNENRAYWDGMATDWVSPGERSWRQESPAWGIWAIPESQLRTAERLMKEHGMSISWVHGNAESVPCSDASFDFAISEYGAAIWAGLATT